MSPRCLKARLFVEGLRDKKPEFVKRLEHIVGQVHRDSKAWNALWVLIEHGLMKHVVPGGPTVRCVEKYLGRSGPFQPCRACEESERAAATSDLPKAPVYVDTDTVRDFRSAYPKALVEGERKALLNGRFGRDEDRVKAVRRDAAACRHGYARGACSRCAWDLTYAGELDVPDAMTVSDRAPELLRKRNELRKEWDALKTSIAAIGKGANEALEAFDQMSKRSDEKMPRVYEPIELYYHREGGPESSSYARLGRTACGEVVMTCPDCGKCYVGLEPIRLDRWVDLLDAYARTRCCGCDVKFTFGAGAEFERFREALGVEQSKVGVRRLPTRFRVHSFSQGSGPKTGLFTTIEHAPGLDGVFVVERCPECGSAPCRVILVVWDQGKLRAGGDSSCCGKQLFFEFADAPAFHRAETEARVDERFP